MRARNDTGYPQTVMTDPPVQVGVGEETDFPLGDGQTLPHGWTPAETKKAAKVKAETEAGKGGAQ